MQNLAVSFGSENNVDIMRGRFYRLLFNSLFNSTYIALDIALESLLHHDM